MEMMEVAAILEAVQLQLQAGFLGERPLGSYSLSEEENQAAEAWILEWLRRDRMLPPLDPMLCRTLWPRFALAALFVRDGEDRQKHWGLQADATAQNFFETLLIHYWPWLRRKWIQGDALLN